MTLSAGAAPLPVDAPDAIAKLVAGTINLDAPEDDAARASLLRRLQKEIPSLLATEGYFSPAIELREAGAELRVVISPGPRATISGVRIAINGVADEKRAQAMRESWTLKHGDPFRQADWDTAKQQVLRQLLAEDYAAASLVHSEAGVDAAAATVSLEVTFAAGPRYRFGMLKMDGLLRYRPDLVERFNRSVTPGAPYREADLLALQSNLQNTPYFASVLVELEAATAPDADGGVTAPVNVHLRERSPHRVGVGAGLSSNTGARVELNYRSADLFHRAWELSSGVRIEQLKQSAYADIFLPPASGNYRDSFGGVVERSNIRGLAIHRTAIGANRTQQRGRVELRLGINWQTEERLPLDAMRSSNQALTLNAGAIWRSGDNLPEMAEGQSAQLQVGGGAKALLSDQDFVRLYGRYQAAWRIGKTDSLMLHAEGGATVARSRNGIPQDFVFRAGGTNSVRGYAYQSLGVKEGSATVGGRYLATLSSEYTHWLSGPWGIAGFVDAGDAADSRQDFRLAVGYGLGARWRSPAGPLAIDIGHGRRTGETRLHFSLAVPF